VTTLIPIEDPNIGSKLIPIDDPFSGVIDEGLRRGAQRELGRDVLAEQPQQEPTRAVKELPEIGFGGLLSGEDMGTVAKIAGLLAITTNPREMGDILTNLVPHIGITSDEQGNLIASNNKNGAQVMINKPGFSKLDAAQALGIMTGFTPAGMATAIPKTMAKRGAVAALTGSGTQAVIETAQKAGGGEFSEFEVGLAGGLSAAFIPLEFLGAGYRAYKGSPKSDIVDAGKEAGIPVMTSDIVQPKTFVGKTAQQVGEKIPIVGTSGLREQQQNMRVRAVEDIAQRYGQFSYPTIVNSLKEQKNRIKRTAGSVLGAVGRTLDELGNIPLNNTMPAIGRAQELLSKPGVIPSKIADLAFDRPSGVKLWNSNFTSDGF